MKKIILLLILLSIQLQFSSATGPPVDDSTGEIQRDCIMLFLDSSQIIQVSRVWAFELNESQKEIMRKYNKKSDIRILNVLSYPYYDCTCGSFVYGIWNRKDSVGVLIEDIKEYNTLLKEQKEYYGELSYYKYLKTRKFPDVIKRLESNDIYIDFEGKTYIKYKEVTEDDIYKLINKKSKIIEKEEDRAFKIQKIIVFMTAPLINKETSKLIRDKIMNFKKYCDKKGVECFSFVIKQ